MIRTWTYLVAVTLALCAGASASVPKFGYILPMAQYPVMQPAMDRYAGSLRDRLSAGGAVTFESFQGDRASESPDNCRKFGVVGFFLPWRSWHYDSASIQVHAALTVVGCDGTIFYFNEIKREYNRDQAQEPQEQIDAETAQASTALVANFEAFRAEHAAGWSKLISDGAAVRNMDPSGR